MPAIGTARVFRLCLASSIFVFGCAQPAAPPAAPAAPAGRTLSFVERAAADTVVDIGPTGDSVGDVLSFANTVFDADNKNAVGTDQGYCIRTAVGKSWECNWTILLADGQITVEGPFLDQGDSKLAITGGTGSFVGARGEMTLHSRNPQGSEYDFTYKIEG